jgi:hypothetical protein
MGSEDRTVDPGTFPILAVELTPGWEVRHLLYGEEITIGRDNANRICIPNEFVTHFHAKLIRSQDTLTVVDLGSANKTRVNGRVVTREILNYGDEIQFGGIKCRLIPPASPESPGLSRPPTDRTVEARDREIAMGTVTEKTRAPPPPRYLKYWARFSSYKLSKYLVIIIIVILTLLAVVTALTLRKRLGPSGNPSGDFAVPRVFPTGQTVLAFSPMQPARRPEADTSNPIQAALICILHPKLQAEGTAPQCRIRTYKGKESSLAIRPSYKASAAAATRRILL